jgi:prepilin-type processing-associated H-X9-DG protein
LEQASLFGQINFEIPAYQPWELAGRTCPNDSPWVYTQLDVYLCPSDQPRGIHTGASECFAHGNYLANQGWWDWWQQTTQSIYNTRRETDVNTSGVDKRGPFEKVWGQANKGTELKQITDGTSNTVMLGECRQYPGADSRGALFLGSSVYSHQNSPNARSQDLLEWCEGYNGGTDDREGLLNPSAPCSEARSAARGPWTQPARSAHPNGVNASFCDGRVVYISDDVDIDVWRAVSTRGQGETVSLNF